MTQLEDKIARTITIFISVLMLGTVIVLAAVPGIHKQAVAMGVQSGYSTGVSVLDMLRDNSIMLQTSEDYAEQMNHQMRLEIPSTTDIDEIKVKSDYMARSITITIPGIGNTYFYDYPMIGTQDGIMDLWYDVSDGKGTLDIRMDGVYECETTVKDRYLYLDFLTPHEKYDHVVVVDAGHGGEDVGANMEGIYEKDISLAVVKQLKQKFDADEHNIGVYYTRTKDNGMSLAERVDLANAVDADAFVSVHVNSTDSGRQSRIHGTSVLYLVSDESGASKNLAQNCLDGMLGNMGSLSKGLIPGDDIKIIRLSEVPVALCELGFITNEDERNLMVTEDYQNKAAQGIYEGILGSIGIQE